MQTYEEHKDVEAGSPSASPLVGQGTAGRNSSSEGEEEEEDNLAPLRGETVLGSPRASPEQTGHASLNRLGSLMREGLPDDMKGLLVAFKNLTYTVRAKRSELTLLDNVTGFFKPGEMTALVGPSGSGKTTLLDVLAGRKTAGKIKGNIMYGNEEPTKAFLRRHTGYVEQFDTLVENMTVYEMLLYTAQMKLPHKEPKAAKKEAVENIMERLGLTAARDTLIGGKSVKGISGGQAKRVNIGVSIITDPFVLYLDEPTSGLDSFTADEVMLFVKSFARGGITICATIHSPSPRTFELFDSLGLLVQGNLVYFGRNLRPATDYFYNQRLALEPFNAGTDFPAEWLVGLVTGANRKGAEEVKKFRDAYQGALAESVEQALQAEIKAITTSIAGEGVVARAMKLDGRAKYATSTPEWYALQIYFRYRTAKNLKDPLWLSARIVDKAIVISIAASLFFDQARMARRDCDLMSAQQTAACLFMWTAAPMFSAAAYLPTFMLERSLFRRERSDGIFNVLTYYTAKWIEEVIIAIPASLVFNGILYNAVGLAGNFFYMWITWLTTLCIAISLSFCFAMLSPTLDFANGSVPSYGGTLLYFMGFLISLNQIPPWWIWYSYIDFLRHAYVGMMVNEFWDYGTSDAAACANAVVPVNRTTVLAIYGMQDERAALSYSYLIIFLVVFWCGALFLLKYLKYGSR